MPILKISSLLLLVSATLAFARLGENESQCNGRYGTPLTDKSTLKTNKEKPLLPAGYTKTYDYQGWKIRIAYAAFNGPAIKMSFRKRSGGSIKEDELAAILKANSRDGTAWERTVYTSSPLKGAAGILGNIGANTMGAASWRRSDGVHATLEPLKQELILEAPSAVEAMERGKKQLDSQQKASIPTF